MREILQKQAIIWKKSVWKLQNNMGTIKYENNYGNYDRIGIKL